MFTKFLRPILFLIFTVIGSILSFAGSKTPEIMYSGETIDPFELGVVGGEIIGSFITIPFFSFIFTYFISKVSMKKEKISLWLFVSFVCLFGFLKLPDIINNSEAAISKDQIISSKGTMGSSRNK